jgi:hypothetical protein
MPEWIRVTKDRRIAYYPSGKKGDGVRKFERGGKTDAEVEARVRVIIKEVELGASLKIDANATWAAVFVAWEAEHAGIIKEGTYRKRLTAVNAHLLPSIGAVRVVETDITTLGRVVDHVVASGSKTDNFKSVFQSLMVITGWARTKKWVAAECFGGPVEVKMLFKNGCMRTSTQSATNEDDETSISIADVPTWEDVIRLSSEVGDIAGGRTSSQLIGQKCAAAVRVTAGTGLRLCELLAVTAKRVDLKNGFITVDRQLDRYKVWVPGTPMPTAPTKNRSTRKARIWSSVQADLEFLMDGLEPDDPLVGPYNGISWWADAWGNLLTEAGERCNWTWSGHYLRHHYGSFSTAPVEQGGKGMSYAAVMKSMGHKTLKTTIETYIHDVSRDDEGWID